MEITEAKIKLMPSRSDRLQAFCTITIDNDFVIRDIKIIEGAKGAFVAMPSRKLTDKCPKCGGKNHLRARFCNDCGARLDENRASKDKRGRAKLHADIAHPINSVCRERIQAKIIEAYQAEVERSKQPGYVPAKLYEDEEIDETEDLSAIEETEKEPRKVEPVTPPTRKEAPAKPQVLKEEPEEPAEQEEEAEASREWEKEPESPDKELEELNKELRQLSEEPEGLEEEEQPEMEEEPKKEERKKEEDDFASGIL